MDQSDEQKLAARRPIKTRETSFARAGASLLLKTGLTPNSVSVLSVCFSILAAACLYFANTSGNQWLWFSLAIAGIQLRLLCNLFDGMMAVEGGKATPNGDLYNEIPDRLSDVILFSAIGYTCGAGQWGITLGWAAAISSLLTAYIRLHGASLTGKHDFKGVMGKAQRMFWLSVLLAIAPWLPPSSINEFWLGGLGAIAAAAFATFIQRLGRLSRQLLESA